MRTQKDFLNMALITRQRAAHHLLPKRRIDALSSFFCVIERLPDEVTAVPAARATRVQQRAVDVEEEINRQTPTSNLLHDGHTYVCVSLCVRVQLLLLSGESEEVQKKRTSKQEDPQLVNTGAEHKTPCQFCLSMALEKKKKATLQSRKRKLLKNGCATFFLLFKRREEELNPL